MRSVEGNTPGTRVSITVGGIITANNLSIWEAAATKHGMIIINTGVNYGDSYTRAVINPAGFQCIRQRYRLRQHLDGISYRLDMCHQRVIKQLIKAVDCNLTGETGLVFKAMPQCEFGRCK